MYNYYEGSKGEKAKENMKKALAAQEELQDLDLRKREAIARTEMKVA